MTKLRFALQMLAFTILTFAFASAAQAQATRTFVSGVGNDADPCSRTAPCRTFAGAFTKTFINGEIDALDPGGYGTLNATKSITLDGGQGSGFASILASGTTGVIVNIASGNVNDPHRTVRIRNLSINGTGASGAIGTRTGLDGIRMIAGSSLIVEHTVIQDFSQEGIEIAGGAVEGNQINLVINDVQIHNCNGTGIRVATGAGVVTAMISDVRVQACATGLLGANRTRLNVKNGVFSQNTTGINQTGTDNITNLEDVFVTVATTGIQSSAGNITRVSNSVVTQTLTGLNPNGGTLHSLSGNAIFGNTADGAFNSGPTPKS
jgi:hypothetical protein